MLIENDTSQRGNGGLRTCSVLPCLSHYVSRQPGESPDAASLEAGPPSAGLLVAQSAGIIPSALWAS